MPYYPQLWTAAGAAALMVVLRCAPILLPPDVITRHNEALSRVSRLAISLALLLALYRLLGLDFHSVVAGSIFVGSGLAVFTFHRSLAAALIGAAVVYLGVRLIL
jgi:hypothetical protein